MRRERASSATPRRHRRRAPVGFTLLEIAVAIAVAGVLLLGVRVMLMATSQAADALRESAVGQDRDANGEWLLRALVGQIDGTVGNDAFGGNERMARFATWCAMPAGWLERCRATMAIDSLDGARVLVAALSTGELLVLRQGFEQGSLRYLSDASNGGRWLRAWGTGHSIPLAVGVILDSDTLIVRIGERG